MTENQSLPPKKKAKNGDSIFGLGAPGKIRTPNLLIRSQMLYPVELRALFCKTPNIRRKSFL